MTYRHRSSLILLLAAFFAPSAYSEEPLVLRLGPALARSANFAPALGLQATAAHPAGWSFNPAADDVRRRDRSVVTTTVLGAVSDSGADFVTPAVTASVPLPSYGTLSIAYARTETSDGRTLESLNDLLRSNEFFWGYSIACCDLALGVEARATTAHFQEEVLFSADAPFPTRTETDLEDATLKLGGRLQYSEVLAIGIVGTFSFGTAGAQVRNINPLPNSSPPPALIPADTLLAELDDNFYSQAVRVGLGYTSSAPFDLYIDVEYLNFGSDQLGSLDVGRSYFGLESSLTELWTVYGGLSLDTNSDVTLSAAVSLDYSEHLIAQFGFQNNAFPELSQEFGEIRLLSLSTVVIF